MCANIDRESEEPDLLQRFSTCLIHLHDTRFEVFKRTLKAFKLIDG